MSEDRVSRRRRPAPQRPTPLSTYRVQLGPDLTFDTVTQNLAYYASLGVSHLYLSPILTAAPGSTHGYDVVDHTRISAVLGGRVGFERLARAARAQGLGIVLDIVPNHMAIPTPAWHNHALWSVLRDGPDSAYAAWFDVDWSAGHGAVLMPVLGSRIGDALAANELTVEHLPVGSDQQVQPVLRYFDHVFPIRPGTEDLPLVELLERQHFRLAHWRVGDEEINYRRFFDVGSLAAIRVENDDVFDATHALIIELIDAGLVDGLRIDHPDGLADPAGYLVRLAQKSGGVWVVVEKILAGEESLPPDWETSGTTGYEGLWRLQTAFTDPTGDPDLASVLFDLTGDAAGDLPRMIDAAKREIVTGPLYAEVHRLTDLAAAVCRDDVRLQDHTWRAINECLQELLIAFDRYRAYVRPGHDTHPLSVAALMAAAERARERLADDHGETCDVVVDLLLGREAGSAGRTGEPRRDELIVRFQQVCGAVMAKGVEDTAFYRWTELISRCEVGGAPGQIAVSPDELHAFATRLQQLTPVALTSGSTHDTKRSEDTRARLGVLTEYGSEWAQTLTTLRTLSAADRSAEVDGRTENLLWQTLAGTWTDSGAISSERLAIYLTKAMREARTHTTWVSPNIRYEGAVQDYAARVLRNPDVLCELLAWSTRTAPAVRTASLGVKAVQLTWPGVADVYQGTEVFEPTLVDPDNRSAVDTSRLAAILAHLDTGGNPRDLGEEKLLVTSRALRLRRDHEGAYVGPEAGYSPLPTTTGHLFAFARTERGTPRTLTLATRLLGQLHRFGGWGTHQVVLPAGTWQDVLTEQTVPGGAHQIADLLQTYPVALLRAVTP